MSAERDELARLIQVQVDHMYAQAKMVENIIGENLQSNRLRRFADSIGAILTGDTP